MRKKLSEAIPIRGFDFHTIETTFYPGPQQNLAVILIADNEGEREVEIVSVNVPRQAYRLSDGEFFFKRNQHTSVLISNRVIELVVEEGNSTYPIGRIIP